MKRPFSSQAGNVIWIILVAVALLAALSFAVMQGGRTNVNNLTSEQARMGATEIIAFGNAVADAVQKLRLRGCTDTQIGFSSTVFTNHGGTPLFNDSSNPNAPSDGTCDIYKLAGGNVNPVLIPLSFLYDWPGIGPGNTGKGSWRNARAQIPGVGTDAKEDLIVMLTYVKKDVCMKINDLLGIQNPSNYPPVLTNTVASFSGSYNDDNSKTITDPNGYITGKTAFCISHPAAGPSDMHFGQVILAR